MSDPEEAPALEAAVAAYAASSSKNYEAVDGAGCEGGFFTHPLTSALYAAAMTITLDRQPISPAAVIDTLAHGSLGRRLKISEADVKTLAGLIAAPLLSHEGLDVPDAVRRLRTKDKRNRMIGLAKTIAREAELAPDDELDGVADGIASKAIALSEAGAEEREDPRPSAQFALYQARGEYGLSTGFRFYDAPPENMGLGGVIPSTMTILAAPTSHGKSTCATSVVANMCKIAVDCLAWLSEEERGEIHKPRREINLLTVRAEEHDLPIRTVIERQADLKVLYCSTEEVPGRLAMRIIQNALNLGAKEVFKGGYAADTRTLIRSWFDFIDKHVYMYGLSTTASEIARKIRQHRRAWGETAGAPLVVIDHVHRIVGLNKPGDEGSSKGNLNAHWRNVYQLLHDTTKREGVHTLALDQVDKAAKKEWEETNDIVSFGLAEAGDSLNTVDNAVLFGKSRKRLGASLGRIRKARYLEDARTLETPFYLAAYPQYARLTEVSREAYDDMEEMP